MATQTVCPPVEELQGLLSGTLNELSAATVERHVLECSQCAQRLPKIHSELPPDELQAAIAAKRGCESNFGDDDWQAVEQLVRQTESLAAGAADTLSPTGATQPASVEDDENELRQLLAPAESPGELGRLANYRVLRVLGRGGMGIVAEAEDSRLARRVALKILPREIAARPDGRQRFLREARAAAAVVNEHIVTIHDVGEDRGVPFLAMQLLHGETLDARLKRQGNAPLPLAEALSIARQIAAGLAAAHDAGLIHRDIKPANVWLADAKNLSQRRESAKENNGDETSTLASSRLSESFSSFATTARIKLLDFGLARAERDEARLTRSGMIVGTAAFMAPEQARGETIDARVDLFSLGCVLFRMCTGRLPFREADAVSTLVSVATDTPAVPSDLNAELPSELSDLILRLLAKRADDRPASAGEVIDALTQIAHEPQGASPGLKSDAGSRLEPDASAFRLIRGARLRMRVVIVSGVLSVATLAAVIFVQANRETIPIETRDDWIAETSRLTGMAQLDAVVAKLQEQNPGFDGKVVSHEFWDRDPTHAVSNLRIASNAISDLAALRGCPQLSGFLNVGDAPPVMNDQTDPPPGLLRDLTPLADLPQLAVVGIGFQPVSDLSPLRGKKLRNVSFNRTLVEDLGPLSDSLELTHVAVSVSKLRTLAPLSKLRLVELSVPLTQVSDLSPIQGHPLIWLNCALTRVQDLSPLAGAPLEHLECNHCQIKDLSPLRGAPLKFLRCESNEPLTDLTPLRDLPLVELHCDPRLLIGANLDALRAIKSLKTLNGQPAETVLAGK